MTQGFVVVLDGPLFRRLGESEGRFSASVTDRALRSQSLLEHPEQHWHLTVHVVIDPDLGLPRMAPVEATAVLDENTLP